MRNAKALSVLTLAAACGTASAAIPVVGVSVTAGSATNSASLDGTAVGGVTGQYSYAGSLFSPASYFCDFSLNAMDTSVVNRMVFGGLVTLINGSSSAQSFVVTMSASTVGQGGSSLAGGSMSGTLVADANGASFSTGGAVAGWTGLIGNGASSAVAGTMFAAPLSVTAAPLMTAQIPGQSFGMPIPSLPAAAMGDSVGIRMNFTLGAGDRLDLTTVFVVQSRLPAPGAAALLALAGAVPARRRR